ncbi:MAG: hypothetical protein K6G00_12170 [Treponema sp.]|nr:hypothetical protein [Treponema sp.]
MIQFYFLSILFNLLTGLILVYCRNLAIDDDFSEDTDSTNSDLLNGFKGMDNSTFRLVLGGLCVITGIMKLLSSYDVAVIGDLIPAAASLLGGAALLVEYYSISSESIIPEHVQSLFVDNRKYIGVFCLVSAILHFILPNVLFL